MNETRRPENPRQLLQIGTRGSPLALAQARMTAQALLQAHPGIALGEQVISTRGDRVQDRPLREIGGKALWTRELDRALLDSEIDCAVHSMKDVETRLAEGIVIAAILPRADVRDRLIGAASLAALPHGATIGTSSPRRAAQLLHRRPDLTTAMLRGNVDTRLQQVRDGAFAATFLAAAGLDRLGRTEGAALALQDWLPACGQGAVGIACRAGDGATRARLAAIDHAPTHLAVIAERGLLEGLGGSCHTAVAAHARFVDGALDLVAELYSPDGRDCVSGRDNASGPVSADQAHALGLRVAGHLRAHATPAILESLTPG